MIKIFKKRGKRFVGLIAALVIVSMVMPVFAGCTKPSNSPVAQEQVGDTTDVTAVDTPVPTVTNTPTPVPTATNTPTPVPTATNTPTPVPTATNTPTPAVTPEYDVVVVDANTFEVYTEYGLEKALYYGRLISEDVTIILRQSIKTSTYYSLSVSSNINLVVPDDVILTIDAGFLYLDGTLTSSVNNIVADYYARIVMYPNRGVWNRGEQQYSTVSECNATYTFDVDKYGRISAYNFEEVDLIISAPVNLSPDEFDIWIKSLIRTNVIVNGKYYVWDGYNQTHEAEAASQEQAPWKISSSCEVDNADDLLMAMSYYSKDNPGQITLVESAVFEGVPGVAQTISPGCTLIINPGVTLTLDDCCIDIYGTLISAEDGLNINEGWMWLDAGGKWQLGNAVIATDTDDGRYAASPQRYGCAFRIDGFTPWIIFSCGYYSNLRISDPLNELKYTVSSCYEGAAVYFNDERIY